MTPLQATQANPATQGGVMEYKCPIYESSAFICDRTANYLVAGTLICDFHAMQAGLTVKVGDNGQVVVAAKRP